MKSITLGTKLAWHHRFGLIFLALVFSVACRAEVQHYQVAASTTDSRIASFDSPHSIYIDPSANARNQLLVFLTGTGAKTTLASQEFSRTAAALGYHVIDLMYPNAVPATICWQAPSADCFGAFRREIVTGADSSPLIQVSREESIENRLLQVLRFLAARQPQGGWGQFLQGNTAIAWEKVALAGQSQGGGHAAWMARERRVARVIMLGAPKDFHRRLGRPASWYGPGQTPAERMFAFVHERDEQGCSFAQQLEIFRTMGLPGEPVVVDDARPPYGDSHRLVTRYADGQLSSKEAHVTVISPRLRGRDGQPLFKAVWTYMLTAPTGPRPVR